MGRTRMGVNRPSTLLAFCTRTPSFVSASPHRLRARERGLQNPSVNTRMHWYVHTHETKWNTTLNTLSGLPLFIPTLVSHLESICRESLDTASPATWMTNLLDFDDELRLLVAPNKVPKSFAAC